MALSQSNNIVTMYLYLLFKHFRCFHDGILKYVGEPNYLFCIILYKVSSIGSLVVTYLFTLIYQRIFFFSFFKPIITKLYQMIHIIKTTMTFNSCVPIPTLLCIYGLCMACRCANHWGPKTKPMIKRSMGPGPTPMPNLFVNSLEKIEYFWISTHIQENRTAHLPLGHHSTAVDLLRSGQRMFQKMI